MKFASQLNQVQLPATSVLPRNISKEVKWSSIPWFKLGHPKRACSDCVLWCWPCVNISLVTRHWCLIIPYLFVVGSLQSYWMVHHGSCLYLDCLGNPKCLALNTLPHSICHVTTGRSQLCWLHLSQYTCSNFQSWMERRLNILGESRKQTCTIRNGNRSLQLVSYKQHFFFALLLIFPFLFNKKLDLTNHLLARKYWPKSLQKGVPNRWHMRTTGI